MRHWIVLLTLLPLVNARIGNRDGLLPRSTPKDVPGQYIVVFKEEADPDAVLTRIVTMVDRVGDAPSVLHRYNIIMNGAAMKGLSKGGVALLAQDPDITDIFPVRLFF